MELLKKASLNKNIQESDDTDDSVIRRKHKGVVCDYCGRKEFSLDRYKCLICEDYDLCGHCFEQRKTSESHLLYHPLVRFTAPNEIFAGTFEIDANLVNYLQLKETFKDSIHDSSKCDGCFMEPIVGPRLKCDSCNNYDLCSNCYENQFESGDHSIDHPLLFCSDNKIALSNIRFLNKLGEGGFGSVYKARLLPNNKIVACKTITYNSRMKANGKSLKTFLQSFLRELTAYNELNSNFIIKSYGHCLENTSDEVNCYLVMEYMEKGSLADVIRTEGDTLSLRCKLQMACHIASALKRIHERNFTHRDIRPDNILVTNDYTAKIADMGISKLIANDATNTMVGCLRYMPLEFYSGNFDSQKLDIFTFGLTLYELFTGRPHKIMNRNRKVFLDADIPIFENLIRKCIEDDPSERPTAKYLNDTLHIYYKVILRVITGKSNYGTLSRENKDELFVKIYNLTRTKLEDIEEDDDDDQHIIESNE